MIDLFIEWINNTILNVPDSLSYTFCAIASLMVLDFLFDFFRFLMYYIRDRK